MAGSRDEGTSFGDLAVTAQDTMNDGAVANVLRGASYEIEIRAEGCFQFEDGQEVWLVVMPSILGLTLEKRAELKAERRIHRRPVEFATVASAPGQKFLKSRNLVVE